MAEISTSFRLHDGMSEVLAHINNSLSTVIRSTEQMESTLGKGMNKKGFEMAKSELAQANQKLIEMRHGLHGVGREQDENLKKQRRFNQFLKEGKKSSDELAHSLKKVGASLATLATLKLGGAKLIELSDGLASLEGRLNLINDGSQSNEALKQEMFQSAQRSRGDYLTMANMAAKLNLMAGDSFSSNKESIAFTELMQKQFAIGGASGEEQRSSMLQLTQAMASGRLSGDELRSISENAPLLMKSIAEYMGVSRGELKKLGAEGKITADIIKNSLFASAEETNKKFKEMPMTFSQFKQGLKNEASEAFTPLAKQFSAFLNSEDGKTFYSMLVSGIHMTAKALGGLISFGTRSAVFIKNHWDDVGYIFKGLGILAGVVVAGKFLQMGAMGVRAIAMIATNPYLLGIIAIGGGIIWLLRKMGVSWSDMAGYATGAIFYVGAVLQNIPIGIHNALEFGHEYFQNFFEDVKTGFNKMIYYFFEGFNKLARAFNNTKLAKSFGIELDTFDTSKIDIKKDYYKGNYKDYVNTSDAYTRGKIAGKGFFSEASDKLNDIKNGFGGASHFDTSDFSSAGKAVEGIKSNTDKLAEAVQISADELVHLRGLAEARTFQQISQEFKIDISNSVNGSDSNVDYDGLFTDLVDKMKEELSNTKRTVIGVI